MIIRADKQFSAVNKKVFIKRSKKDNPKEYYLYLRRKFKQNTEFVSFFEGTLNGFDPKGDLIPENQNVKMFGNHAADFRQNGFLKYNAMDIKADNKGTFVFLVNTGYNGFPPEGFKVNFFSLVSANETLQYTLANNIS